MTSANAPVALPLRHMLLRNPAASFDTTSLLYSPVPPRPVVCVVIGDLYNLGNVFCMATPAEEVSPEKLFQCTIGK